MEGAVSENVENRQHEKNDGALQQRHTEVPQLTPEPPGVQVRRPNHPDAAWRTAFTPSGAVSTPW